MLTDIKNRLLLYILKFAQQNAIRSHLLHTTKRNQTEKVLHNTLEQFN